MAYPEDPGSDPESDPVRVRVCPDTKQDPPWPVGVVVLPPGIEGRLHGLNVLERSVRLGPQRG